MNTLLKRGRGRPVGSKDKESRYRPVRPVPEVLKSPAMTVEQKVKLLSDPQKLSVYAKITGLSVGVLRKKVTRGEIQAFHRDGLLRVEPLHFLNWYNGARNVSREHLIGRSKRFCNSQPQQFPMHQIVPRLSVSRTGHDCSPIFLKTAGKKLNGLTKTNPVRLPWLLAAPYPERANLEIYAWSSIRVQLFTCPSS